MLSYYRVVCGTCDEVISDGWPADESVDPEVQRVITKQTCRACEEEDALAAAEARRRGVPA